MAPGPHPIATVGVVTRNRRRGGPDTVRHAAAQRNVEAGQYRPAGLIVRQSTGYAGEDYFFRFEILQALAAAVHFQPEPDFSQVIFLLSASE